MTECELCGGTFEMDVTAVTNIGVITMDACLSCGMQIHDNSKMLMRLVRKKAAERNIKLPADPPTFSKLLLKEVGE